MKDRKTLFKEKFLDRLANKIYNYAGVEDFGFQLVRDAAYEAGKEAYSELEEEKCYCGIPDKIKKGARACYQCGVVELELERPERKCPHLQFMPNDCTICLVEEPKQRWRAEEGGQFFWVSAALEISSGIDIGSGGDDLLFKNFNYFQTKAQAELALQRIKEVLKEFHKNP